MDIDKKTIVTFVHSNIEFDFFYRLAQTGEKIGYYFIFLTDKVSLYFSGKLKKIEIHLVFNYPSFYTEIRPNYRKIIEYRLGILKKKEIDKLYYSIFHNIFNKIKIEKVSYFYIWAENMVSSQALIDISCHFNVPKIHFEISNFPGKILADPFGVNGSFNLAYIKRKITPSNNEVISTSSYDILGLLRIKKDFVPPQTLLKSKINNYFYLFDWILKKINVIPKSIDHSITRKLRKFKKLKSNLYDDFDLYCNEFIFFPMQVSSDSQLIFHSNGYTNITAFEFALDLSNKKGLPLVVKLHPAETDFREIKLLKTKYKTKFLLVNESIQTILQKSKMVVTINSSIGLEAKLMGVYVIFLGNSIYDKLSKKEIISFINNYLINIDFFSSKSIPIVCFKEIIERTKESNLN